MERAVMLEDFKLERLEKAISDVRKVNDKMRVKIIEQTHYLKY